MYENKSLIPDWDTFRLVLAIDRFGGISGAAKSLGVTHATVSRRLARAESDANMLFFDRLPAGLRLTKAGAAVLAQAEDMEPGLDRLERTLLSAETGLAGPLRITLPPLLLIGGLAATIARFAAAHPEIELYFVGDNQLLNLHQREADVAIRVTHKPPETLWGRKISEQSSGFYAATDWLAKNPVSRDVQSFALPLISFSSWPSPVPKIIKTVFPNAHVVARCDDMVAAVQMAKTGLGVTRMPRFLGEGTEGVTRLDCLPWETYFPVWCLTHPELRNAPRVKAFMRFVASAMTEQHSTYVAQ
jgi:DNA-binding transcriptional LysR family regulator